MLRAISADGGVVLCALDSTNLVAEMERIHQPSAVVSAALGRLLTAAALMGSFLKSDNDSLTLRVNGGGPAGTVLAVADGRGRVRGYAANPLAEAPLRADGKLNVGAVVGHEGSLSVIRDMGLKEPYVGQVPLVSGEIAEDITAYYAASEQTPSVCALGVLVNPDLSIRRAGGFLLQLLPGASEREVARLEENVRKVPSVTDYLEDGGTMEDLAKLVLEGFEPEILDRSNASYHCHCSAERTRAILKSLGRDELSHMRDENPVARVECHFCNRVYEFDLADIITEILDK